MVIYVQRHLTRKEENGLYNYDELLGLIVAKYRTRSAFAKALNISERSLSLKLNNKVPFTQKEIDNAVELLGIRATQISSYFFNKNVKGN